MADSTLISSATNESRATAPPKSGPVIALLVVATFVVILNETIMGVALPHLMRDLSITASTAQWLTTSYLLTMAVVIPVSGFLLQRLTTRTLFFAAMALFSAGTLIAALSPDFGTLLLGRVVQASGTAVMMPLLMTTVLHVVPPERRGRTMGVVSIVISVAPAIGPTASGAILSVLDWRWLFWSVLPISAATIVIGIAFVKNVSETRRVPVDLLSIVISAVAFGGIVFGLSSIGEAASGHASVAPWIPIVAGLIALAAFVLRQRLLQRENRALLDLRVFQNGTFRVAVLLLVVVMATLFGALILLPIYLQNVLDVDTLTTGLILLPGGVLMGVLAPLVGSLFDRVGARSLVVPAAIGLAAVLWWMTTLSPSSPIGLVVAMHVALSLSLAFMFTPLFTSALGSLPPQLYSHGSAIMGTVQQVAGALGTALFITALSVASANALVQGAGDIAAQAAGFRMALVLGACLATVGVIVACFTPAGRPTATSSQAPTHH